MAVISGQVSSYSLGTDAFQEIDIVGITLPITKWSYQIRRTEDIAWAVARAFYIAKSGRPGPVVLDLTKDAQIGLAEFNYETCTFIRSYIPIPKTSPESIEKAAELINQAKKPLALVGQGVILSGAEEELKELLEKADIPAACTLLGLSALDTDYPLNKGMLGMHGNIGPNMLTNECDVLIAIGMRFDDRVTGDLKTYALQAKVIHLDIDPSEIDKNVKATVAVIGDAKASLREIGKRVNPTKHTEWIEQFTPHEKFEYEKVLKLELLPEEGPITMGEVVRAVSEATDNKAILVTDVGQNQMMGARYFKFSQTRSIVTSGGLGTMGFALPAAIGAKLGAPDRTVCCFFGDGGFQMTIQELGTIMQSELNIKMIVLNNHHLGMVRQWQELFFDKRYSETPMMNPDFITIAKAYGIKGKEIFKREELNDAIEEMIAHDGSYLLEVNVEEMGMVYPMIPAGKTVTNIITK
ncbi:biosynthetic-type acetolactate synthase large subunit [Porphyromonadaceae bacterium]